jgi:hypothetical protein
MTQPTDHPQPGSNPIPAELSPAATLTVDVADTLAVLCDEEYVKAAVARLRARGIEDICILQALLDPVTRWGEQSMHLYSEVAGDSTDAIGRLTRLADHHQLAHERNYPGAYGPEHPPATPRPMVESAALIRDVLDLTQEALVAGLDPSWMVRTLVAYLKAAGADSARILADIGGQEVGLDLFGPLSETHDATVPPSTSTDTVPDEGLTASGARAVAATGPEHPHYVIRWSRRHWASVATAGTHPHLSWRGNSPSEALAGLVFLIETLGPDGRGR